jgi:outer membrane protein OmpA-like peptidoglycan-associated protein
MPDRNFRVGYVKYNLPENILFANKEHETTEGSIFKNNGLNVELIECQNYTELANLLKSGGDKGGVDAAYCNTNQFVQKSNLFSESDSKVFLLSDKKTEKNYLITHKTVKNIKELNNKLILANDLNSSDYALTQLLSKNNANSANIIFSTDDKYSYEKLLSGDVSAILIKEEAIINEIKNNKNYKILHELNNSKSNVFISPNSTLNEYNTYTKTFAECCLIANDSLKIQKQSGINTTFADIGSNYSYFAVVPKKVSSAFESEVSNIFNYLQKFIATENLIVPRDLVSIQTFSDIYSASGNKDNITLPDKKDTLFAAKKKTNNNYTTETDKNQTPVNNYEHQNSIEPTAKASVKKQKVYTQQSAKTKTNSKKTTSSKNVYKDPEIESNCFIVTFHSNSIKLDTTAARKLALAAEEIQKSDFTVIELIGHTDFYGKDSYNLQLSKKRALAVMDYLSKNFEIGKDTFTIIGKGASSPIRDNKNNKVRKYNRRVNIVIKEKENE